MLKSHCSCQIPRNQTPGLYLILILLTFTKNYSFQTVKQYPFSHESHVDILAKQDFARAALWSPKTTLQMWPDFRQIQLCKLRSTDYFEPTIVMEKNGHKFEWTSISLFSMKNTRKSYILLGGSYRREFLSASTKLVSPRIDGILYLCQLEVKDPKINLHGFGWVNEPCILLKQREKSRSDQEFLGATSEALNLNENVSLIVYCDPLWRANSKVPVGRCFAHIINNGRIEPSLELAHFCQSGMQVATPCGAGQSIALSLVSDTVTSKSLRDLIARVQLWVGEPLSPPHGRIQIVTNPYGSMQVTTISRPINTTSGMVGSAFGYAIAEGYTTAPSLSGLEGINHDNLIQLIGVHLSKSAGDSSDLLGTPDWFAGIDPTKQFSGFGTSIVRVKLFGSFPVGVIVGAPYTGHASGEVEEGTNLNFSTRYNRGRIYLYCQSLIRSHALNGTSNFDYIDGPVEASNFGYALSNLGDIDGDGNEDIAVGAPDLQQKYGPSYIYLIRILSECRFDRNPMEVLISPGEIFDFGAHLPVRAEDLDNNGWTDLVVPVSNKQLKSLVPAPLIYATRAKYRAECHFIFPPWLAIRRLLIGDYIPVQTIVYFHSSTRSYSRIKNIENIIPRKQLNQLLHQTNTDWNASDSLNQRFSLRRNIQAKLDLIQNFLQVNYELMAEQNVEDMNDLDDSNSGIFIGYRFLQPCYSGRSVLDTNGTCPDGSWLKRPLIDWSNCIAKVPLTRYVCYPSANCQSDIAIRVKELKSGSELYFHSVNLTTNNGSLEKTINIAYGDTESSRQQLQIKLYNFGPTFAHGVRLELQFHGNLRFSRLESLSDRTTRTELLIVDVSANETWANFYVGDLPPPLVNEDNVTIENSEPVYTLLLSTFYTNFTLPEYVDFRRGAGVTIQLISGTPDPNLDGNTVRVNYAVLHQPNIRISYGPKELASVMDNRSLSSLWLPGQQQRVLVSEVGPKVEHTFQIEYLGPSTKLHNVTFNLSIPIELNTEDRDTPQASYLVYLFDEIRAQTEVNSALEWVNVEPKIYATSRNGYGDLVNVGRCSIQDAEKIVNPRGMIAMDIGKVYSRQKRHALYDHELDVSKLDMHPKGNFASSNHLSNENEPVEPTKLSRIQFRRVQKEVFQCDRVGNRIRKPICAQVICHVDELLKHRPVLITITGWLWIRTFFAKHISDLDIVTSITVSHVQIPEGVLPSPEPVGHFYLSQTFFFPQIRPKLLHQIPIWPVIVGIVLGIIVLALIVILLYVLGFFRRRKPGLRKARLGKGGAEDIAQRDHDENVNTSTTRRDVIFDSGMNTERSHKKKHKKDLNILHPADLCFNTEAEQQKLIADSN